MHAAHEACHCWWLQSSWDSSPLAQKRRPCPERKGCRRGRNQASRRRFLSASGFTQGESATHSGKTSVSPSWPNAILSYRAGTRHLPTCPPPDTASWGRNVHVGLFLYLVFRDVNRSHYTHSSISIETKICVDNTCLRLHVYFTSCMLCK